jgi:1-acyl-sn-glycerol-3-phosphate acyltransferase
MLLKSNFFAFAIALSAFVCHFTGLNKKSGSKKNIGFGDFVISHAIFSGKSTMGKIQDYNFLYSFLRPYVDMYARRAYRRFEVHGKENIPKNGSLIFGVNHSNTLMDALVVLASSNHKKVFMARGDIFSNPTIAKILSFLRILPIYRIRNGFAAVKNNNASIIEKAVDVLHDEVRFFLFPEGAHRTKHSLLKLSKGVFHIALKANEEFGDEKPIYIIPTAIEYGDYFRFHTTAMVNFGKPIEVGKFIADCHEENEAILINLLKEELYRRMSELFTFIPDDDDYPFIWEIVKMKNEKRAGGLYSKMIRNRKTVENVLKFREEKPEEAAALFQKVKQFADDRVRNKISVTSVAKKKPLVNALWKILVILIGMPYYIASAIVNSPTWITTLVINNRLKDKAFKNTVSFGVRFVLAPMIFIAAGILLFWFVKWQWALLGMVLLYFSYGLFCDYNELVRRCVSDIRWTFKHKLRKEYEDLSLNNLF